MPELQCNAHWSSGALRAALRAAQAAVVLPAGRARRPNKEHRPGTNSSKRADRACAAGGNSLPLYPCLCVSLYSCDNYHMAGMANTAPRPCLFTHSQSHTHTLTISCTCCYDEIKGIQDLKIYSNADSLILSLYSHGGYRPGA